MLLQTCMLASLAWELFRAVILVFVSLPVDLLRSVIGGGKQDKVDGVTFYEGKVKHVRQRPVHNSFCYSVRMALISLNTPPSWWQDQANNFLSAAEARTLAGTDGEVLLLTNPVTAGYNQNPISIYYCYSVQSGLQICIAEVTNTPWGAKVSFLFDPQGETVPKALHVSPFMDMQNTWRLKSSVPGKCLSVSVEASHPEHGDYFSAQLGLQIAEQPSARSEEASFQTLLKYGYQPQRDALLIYWQAVKLLWKGVPFYAPPKEDIREQIQTNAQNPKMTDGKNFHWQPARRFPWTADQ